jgi:hypothetical protein
LDLCLPDPSPKNTPKITPRRLIKEDYYFGNLSRADAETMLLHSKSKVFLVRASSNPGCYALSKFDYTAQTLLHLLVVPVGSGGYKITECPDTNIYQTLDDLVNNSPIIAGYFIAKPPPPPE